MIYLAAPYSDPDPTVRIGRFNQVCKKALELMETGKVVFSPISHSHPIDPDNAKGYEFWMHQDLNILDKCRTLYVYKLPGWEESKGLKSEIGYAEEVGIPTVYLEP